MKRYAKFTLFTSVVMIFFSVMASALSTPDPIDIRLKRDLSLNEIQAVKLKSILNEIGVYEYHTALRDPLLDNANNEGEKAYRVNTKEFKNIIIFMCDEGFYFKVKYNGIVLYDNETFQSKAINTVIPEKEQKYLMEHTMLNVNSLLNDKNSSVFDDSCWKYGVFEGEEVVQGCVTTTNILGENIVLDFQTKYKAGTIVSLILGDKEYIKK